MWLDVPVFENFARPLLIGSGALLWVLGVAFVVTQGWGKLRARARVSVQGKWVVVTGCDSGFGRGVVENLVERGAHVIATCYTEEGAAAARAVGAKHAPQLDLTDDDAVVALARDITTWSDGSLHAVVHNAGIVLPGFVDYQPIGFYRRVMDVNFYAPVLLTQHLLGALRAARGRVVLVSSVDGLVSLPGNAPYDASKFAVEAYADALRTELAHWDVGVSVINPSTMRTPLAMTFFDGHRKAYREMETREPNSGFKETYPEAWLEEYIAFNAKQLDQIAQSPQHAIDDIVHALTAKRPHFRYLSGTLAKTLFYALWVGPESWSFRFKRSLIRPLPPAAPRKGG